MLAVGHSYFIGVKWGKMQLNVPLVSVPEADSDIHSVNLNVLNTAIALSYPDPLKKNALSSVKTVLERAKTSMI